MRKVILIVLYLLPNISFATDLRPVLDLPKQVEVNSDVIKLGEIAVIKVLDTGYSKLVEDLKKVNLGEAPRPLSYKNISGEEILNLIEANGIPRDAFGYSLPVQVSIKRAGRILKIDEVTDSVREKVNKDPNLDIQIKSVNWDTEQILPLGTAKIDAELLSGSVAGKMPVRISVFIGDVLSSRFLATALVDDWKALPILKSKVERGSLIHPSDLQMVRTNLAGLPSDIALSVEEITGRRVTKTILNGEPVRRSDVDIPPLIEKGKIVKMKFQTGGFTAIATGVAMTNGQIDEEIEIKNDRSHKIVKGKITSKDEVLVKN
jgi:flagella basal body P-ring formation protein FlgA